MSIKETTKGFKMNIANRTLTDTKAYNQLIKAIKKENLKVSIKLDDAGEPYVKSNDGVSIYADVRYNMFYRNNVPQSIETLKEAMN